MPFQVVRLTWNRRNHDRRWIKERYILASHTSIDDLKMIYWNQYVESDWRNNCLQKSVEPNYTSRYFVPHYPQPVEFHVSRITHVTHEGKLYDIQKCRGFGGSTSGFLYWGPAIGRDEKIDAEQRYLEKLFPDRSQEEREEQKPFLDYFTTSPAFTDKSWFGNFRFTFSLDDVLQEYSQQFCRGQKPVFRIHKTAIYRQQIKYVVLVHSPDAHDYDGYPVLGDNADGVCAYRDGQIIWRAQAMSGTHTCRLIKNNVDRIVSVEDVDERDFEYYVWDHVTLALYIPTDSTLNFPREKLRRALNPCDDGYHELNPLIGIEKAKEIVDYLVGHN